MARSRSLRLLALTLANALLPAAVLVFALGFFPFKPLLPGLATFEDEKELETVGSGQSQVVFDRVVFMVVDALRTDFVYGHNSGFEFTQSLIRNGAAIPFTAHAAPPTVTMPRIKALTTGSVPSFADLIFNLDESDASSLAGQDTWLAQIRAKGGRLVFYGDDTWLRLFPGSFFSRAEGTSSFFVSDFTEVDNNVTRHVPGELAHDDWNAMILHYLGLDHIGHKTGPQGPNMLPKQREMDGIVRSIYEAMETESHHANTLLVLAGDHGMNAGGNHGGSGPGETEPALVFASPKFKSDKFWNRKTYECPTRPKEGTEFHYYTKIQQSDLVPTLAALMNFPIPKNGLGVLIKELWGVWPNLNEVIDLLNQNGRQMKRIIEAKFGALHFNTRVSHFRETIKANGKELSVDEDDERLAYSWALVEHEVSKAATGETKHTADTALFDFLELGQDVLSNAASMYNIPKMVIGIVTTALALGLAMFSLRKVSAPGSAGIFFAVISILYGVMMFATSYVEEEQHFWYWLTPCWVTLLTMKSVIATKNRSMKLKLVIAGLLIMAVHRVSIRWNQTGQKHSGEPDIVHNFFPQHHILMWSLILATYVYVGFQLASSTLAVIVTREMAALAAVSLVVPSIIFKLNFTQADAPELVQGLAAQIREWTEPYDLVLQAQLAFTLLGLITVAITGLSIFLARSTPIASESSPAVRITLPERLHYLLTLFLITQSRAPNIPLFLGLEIQQHALRWLLHPLPSQRVPLFRNANIKIAQLATTVLLLSHVGYFCFGGSNSISSVDLSNAYNGVGDYSIVAVGILLFSSNWTAPIYWCSAAALLTFSKLSKSNKNDNRAWIDAERTNLEHDGATMRKYRQASTSKESWFEYVSAMTAFIATSLLAIMAACTALRTHLFIWTVFSPKYLYSMAWCVGWHLIINIMFGSLLRYLGQIA